MICGRNRKMSRALPGSTPAGEGLHGASPLQAWTRPQCWPCRVGCIQDAETPKELESQQATGPLHINADKIYTVSLSLLHCL